MYNSPVMLPNSQKPYRQSISDIEPRLPESALFDKVINVAIHRENKPDIIIRSDYELIVSGVANLSTVVLDDNLKQSLNKASRKGLTWSIVRSTYKPSIQVKFNVLNSSLIDAIDLMIGNLFVFTGEGSMSLYDFMGKTEYNEKSGKPETHFPITGFDILIGYASQFPKPVDPEDYFNVSVENAPLGVSALRINSINYCSYDKAPPNSIFRIHGYVGSLQRFRVKDYVYQGQTILMSTSKDFKPIAVNNPKDLFYNLIQRRFLRDKHAWDKAREYEVQKEQAKIAKKTQTYNDYKAKHPDSKRKLDTDIKKRYIADDGYLNREGADLFGCKIIIPKASYLNKFRFDKSLSKDENGKPVKLTINDTIASANDVPATLKFLDSKFFGNKLKSKQLLNGNYVVWLSTDLETSIEGKNVLKPIFPSPADKYEFLSSLNECVASQMPALTTEDAIEKINKDMDITTAEPIIIPAVYNISVSAGTTVISCPFFNLLNPFRIVAFNSRYNLSDFSRDFAAKVRNQVYFSVINYSVDFSTTGKENMVTILAIDASKVNVKAALAKNNSLDIV